MPRYVGMNTRLRFHFSELARACVRACVCAWRGARPRRGIATTAACGFTVKSSCPPTMSYPLRPRAPPPANASAPEIARTPAFFQRKRPDDSRADFWSGKSDCASRRIFRPLSSGLGSLAYFNCAQCVRPTRPFSFFVHPLPIGLVGSLFFRPAGFRHRDQESLFSQSSERVPIPLIAFNYRLRCAVGRIVFVVITQRHFAYSRNSEPSVRIPDHLPLYYLQSL
jgi:hypothetical protein